MKNFMKRVMLSVLRDQAGDEQLRALAAAAYDSRGALELLPVADRAEEIGDPNAGWLRQWADRCREAYHESPF
jgi:hypothetical protein